MSSSPSNEPGATRSRDGTPAATGRQASARARVLAGELLDALRAAARSEAPASEGEAESAPDRARSLPGRVLTDPLLCETYARDLDAHRGPTVRRLTRPVPDVVFRPEHPTEVADAFLWARRRRVPVTLRGAATTTMGGAVPADGGLVLDLARLDGVRVDARHRRVVFGAGVRLGELAATLAREDLALPVHPAHPGGTYAGWLATGGAGMNAYGLGRAMDHVHAVELVLPGGEWLHLARDRTLTLLGRDGARSSLTPLAREAWFAEQGYPLFSLDDAAGCEGQLGAIVALEVGLQPRPAVAPFLLAFPDHHAALLAFTWLEERVGSELEQPANVKLLSGPHLARLRRLWDAEGPAPDARERPWSTVHEPEDLGVPAADRAPPAAVEAAARGACLYVDFLAADAGRRFARLLPRMPGGPRVLAAESGRYARERFGARRFQRLDPPVLTAQVLLPSKHVDAYVVAAARLARRAEHALDVEVTFLRGRKALVAAGFECDPAGRAVRADRWLAPALVDLALARFGGAPYVLGRWQAVYRRRKYGPAQRRYAERLKAALDPEHVVSRGVFFDPGWRGVAGLLARGAWAPAVRALRLVALHAPPLFALWRRGLRLLPPGRPATTAPAPAATPAEGRPAAGRPR